MEKLRILVADAHTFVRYALWVALPQMHGVAAEVVNDVTAVDDLPTRVVEFQPALLLLDWEFPNLTVAHLQRLRETCPPLKIIALSVHTEARESALRAGVDAFVSKADGAEALMRALQTLIEDCSRQPGFGKAELTLKDR